MVRQPDCIEAKKRALIYGSEIDIETGIWHIFCFRRKQAAAVDRFASFIALNISLIDIRTQLHAED